MPYKVKFTTDEIKEIRKAHSLGHTSWDTHKGISSVKRKIKTFCSIKNGERCCYCGRNQHGEFGLSIDIEHVLPKSVFLRHMFTIKNLSTSCKRCNMSIKKNKVDFLSEEADDLPKRLFRSRYYKFIHPHLDKYDAHLRLFSIQVDSKRIIKYSVVDDSDKGTYTYKYFNLKALEMNSFDIAQGGKGRPEIINPIIAELFENVKP